MSGVNPQLVGADVLDDTLMHNTPARPVEVLAVNAYILPVVLSTQPPDRMLAR